MKKPTRVTPLPGFRLHIRFEDGVEGEVDLAHLAGKGVFVIWNDREAFESVSIGECGEISWSGNVDICSDALYLKITGKSPEDLFPALKASANA